jgi:NAD(P) transhydrogenase
LRTFDLIVIGGGAAGEKGAVQAAYFKKSVLLVEQEKDLGGATVFTGTLPSKTLRETALHLSGFRQRGLFGVELSVKPQIQVKDLLSRLGQVTQLESGRMAQNLKTHGVTCVAGAAHFIDEHTIEVRGERYVGAHILLATGSRPYRPPEFPFQHDRVYDSDEIVRVHEIPTEMVVVGAGVIGVEYACLFAALGTRVTVLEPKDSFLAFVDEEVRNALKASVLAMGVAFRFQTKVLACEVDESASMPVKLCVESGEELRTRLVLVCAGREANTATLQLAAAGLSPGKRGQLSVNAQFVTAVPHIAAAGDVIGFPALASTAMEQARVAVCQLFGFGYKTQVAPVFPYGIYTIPEISTLGETEASAKEKNIPVAVGRADFSQNLRGAIIGDTGFLKLLFHRNSRKLLGAHCIGEGATELIHVALMGLHLGATVETFIEMCFNFPTLSEAYKYAAYDALQNIT